MSLWLIILAMGVITFGLRLALILGANRIQLPVVVARALRYAPVAVLAAIISVEVGARQGQIALSAANSRLIAALLAGVVAWRTRNVLLTIAAGLILFWLL